MSGATTPAGTTPQDDATLLAASRRGDAEAFAALVERHSATMTRVARVYTADRAAAERSVVRGWLRTLTGGRPPDHQPVHVLLAGSVLNELRATDDAQARAATTATQRPEPSLRDGPATTSRRSAPTERSVRRALETLREDERLVVTLRDVEGWTAMDVCALLGVDDGTQRRLLRDARTQLCAMLYAVVTVASGIPAM